MLEQFKDKVAIVTGAGAGLGRTHALELAKHGVRVVVNDLGEAADEVAADIRSAAGDAIAVHGDVTRFEDMRFLAEQAIGTYGHVDILINNAGILRDRSFAKMDLEDFRLVMDVHLMGAVNITKALWPYMQAERYGRIVMTTSSSGLYGNFGQSNYSAAKMALVGLMQTLSEEGAKYNIRVNCLAPSAVTQMTANLLPDDALTALTPERVSPALLALTQENAPTGMIMLAGGGSFEAAYITMTQGIFIPDSDSMGVELCDRLEQVQNQEGQLTPQTGWEQMRHELAKIGTHTGQKDKK